MLVKSFDSTITNPKFIATHLNQTISLSNNNTHTHNGYLLYTPHPSSPYIEEELRTIVYNTDHTLTEVHTVVYNTDHSLTEVSSFEIPYVLGGTNIVAFCNGLFCLTNNFEKSFPGWSLYLWNPSIKMFKMVPTRDYLTVSSVTLGFAHQYNDLLLKFQLRFSRISLASDSGCCTQCRLGDCWDNNNICFFITKLKGVIADLGFQC